MQCSLLARLGIAHTSRASVPVGAVGNREYGIRNRSFQLRYQLRYQLRL